VSLLFENFGLNSYYETGAKNPSKGRAIQAVFPSLMSVCSGYFLPTPISWSW